MANKKCELTEELSPKFILDTIKEDAKPHDIVGKLILKGDEIARKIRTEKVYASFEDFKNAHKEGKSPLIELEGKSKIEPEKNIVILRDCPMVPVLNQVMQKLGEKLPEYFNKVVEEYIRLNPDDAAIIHPLCIAHQRIRELIISNLKIGETHPLNFYQLSCRSTLRQGGTGKNVYSERGLKKTGMSREDVDPFLTPEDNACIYYLFDTREE